MHTQIASTQAPRPASGRAMGPLQISEIILHTRHFDIMQGWYSRLFDGLKPAVESEPQRGLKSAPEVTRLCFFRIHFQYPFTQVLGLFEVPEITSGNPRAPGLNHMQFREASLENLFQRYDMLKAQGVLPFKTYNHGPGSSFYYRDPDGNEVELSATNFSSQEDYLAFMRSEAFRSNVEGHAVDAQSYIAEVRAALGMSDNSPE